MNVDGRAAGVDISAHLLELSRVTLLDNATDPFKMLAMLALGLRDRDEDFKITPDMKEQFLASRFYSEEDCISSLKHLHVSLAAVGVSERHWNDILSVLSAVMHLQCLIVGGSNDGASISTATKSHVGHAERLLQLETATLGPAILKKTMEIAGSKSYSNLTPEDCKASIAALSGELYQRVVNHLLHFCSTASMPANVKQQRTGPVVRIFDAFGSEVFDSGSNRLAQFSVNLIEEKVQDFSLHVTFRKELDYLFSEGVEVGVSGNIDNSAILDVLEKVPAGIVSLIEEASLFPRGNDNGLLDKIFSTHTKGKMVRAAGRQAKPTCFFVKHSFGDVLYDADGFVASNKTKPSNDVIALVGSLAKTYPFLVEGEDKSSSADDAGDAGHGKSNRSLEKAQVKAGLLTNKTRDILSSLLNTIKDEEQNVIFCIRANSDFKSFTFDPSHVVPQVKQLQLVELADFCKRGFAQRSTYTQFYEKYRVLFAYNMDGLPWKMPAAGDMKALCRSLLRELGVLACLPDMWTDDELTPVFGKTCLFIKVRLLNALIATRDSVLQQYAKSAVVLQALVRMKLASMRYNKMFRGMVALQSGWRMHSKRSAFVKQRNAASCIKGFYLMRKLTKRYQHLKHAVITIKSHLLNKMIARIRYKKLQRASRKLHFLARGFVYRQQINVVLRAILKLQKAAKDFLRRNKLFYFRKLAVVIVQRVFRGYYSRLLNRPIVRALQIRRNQRIGIRAVKLLQSHWRRRAINHQYLVIRCATRYLQHWAHARKVRFDFLKMKYLVKWLQCSARRVAAVNIVNLLRLTQMLKQETEALNRLRRDELAKAHANDAESSGNAYVHLGGGFSRNAHDKFTRYLFGFDVLFDISSAYPDGWLHTVMEFEKKVRATGKRRVVQIAVGSLHTVLVDSVSNIYTFGVGDNGQLGHGTRGNEAQPRLMETLAYQASLTEGGLNRSLQQKVEVAALCAGRDHTLLVSRTGKVYSWGENRRGQLGHSGFKSSSLPRLVNGIINARQVACGAYSSVCLADPGILYTWGASECLGRSKKGAADSCEAQSVPFFSKRRVQCICAGDNHVVVRSGSDFFSWGANSFGQLGIGNCDVAGVLIPTQVKMSTKDWSAADLLSCVLKSSGRHTLLLARGCVWAWGWNKFGQIGNETLINVPAPNSVRFQFGSRKENSRDISIHIEHITVGWRHSLAVSRDGNAFIWGYNVLENMSVDASHVDDPFTDEDDVTRIPPDSDKYLTSPCRVTLPPRFTSTKILGLSGCNSNTCSVTALDVLELDPPVTAAKKEKYRSKRETKAIRYHNSAVIQKEISDRLRKELGGWSGRAHAPPPCQASPKKDDVSEEVSFKLASSWGNGTGDEALLKSGIQVMDDNDVSSSPDPAELRRKREGELADDSILKLFSPVKKPISTTALSASNSNSSLADATQTSVDKRPVAAERRESGSAATPLPVPSTPIIAPSAQSRFTRRRRASVAAMPTPLPADITSTSPDTPSTSAEVLPKTPISRSNSRRQSEFISKNMQAQFLAAIEIDPSLLRRKNFHQETVERIPSVDSEEAKEPDYFGASGGLSMLAVSDLAAMIQNIKQDSLKQVSMKWK